MIFNLTSTLDDREKQTYDLLCRGLSNSDIAKELCISIPAVKKRLISIYRKLGLNTLPPNLQRIHAITYSETRLAQTISVDGKNLYSIEDIINVSKMITWYDRSIVDNFINDLVDYLEHK